MRKRLIDRFVRTVKPTATQADYWDQTLAGFGLRVSPKGKKSFQILYRHHRRQRRMVLGSFPAMSLAEARKYAKQMLADAQKGGDPASARRANRNAETFGRLAAEYMSLQKKREKRSWPEEQRVINVDLLPAWRSHKAKDVGRRDIQELVQKIANRAPIMANRTLTLIRQIFGYGVDQAWFELNPCQRIPRPGVERRRQRVLDPQEIRKLWRVFEGDTSISATALMFQLLTGQRIGEVRRMQVADLDMLSGWWTIPAEIAKNEVIHRIPLSPRAVSILEKRLETTKKGWVFPSSTDKSRPLGYATIHSTVRSLSERAEVYNWNTHDLRRTVATHIAGSGVSRLVVKKILNHRDRDITAVYDRYEYANEKRMALDEWDRRIQGMVDETEQTGNVVSFATAKK